MTTTLPSSFVEQLTRIESLTWPSLRADKMSAWHGHVSLAHWLVSETKPATIVELGSHNGVSYAAFCQAVERGGSPARCFAVDSWEGDSHAGFYSNEVYEDLSRFNREHFDRFSTLLRCYFDDAVGQFEDGSIDLLHIDGLHTYEAVKNDFDTWKPKLSRRAVVLFHDTEIRRDNFGVWQLWDELTRTYPGFNFHHSAGLGVLAVGPDVHPSVYALCNQPRLDTDPRIRSVFAAASSRAQRAGLAGDGLKQADGGTNIALHRPASQSSALDGKMTPQGGNDGLKTGHYGFHTTAEVRPWWMVDLERARSVSRIVIYNRMTDQCAPRSRNLHVMVSPDGLAWNTIYTHDGTVFGGADGHPLVIEQALYDVRFVRLQIPDEDFFHLDEVEIYG